MTSYYQHLNVAEQIWDTFGPTANPLDSWVRHDVFRFEGARISQLVPAIRLDEAGQRELAILRWGLVPPWFKKSPAEAKKFQTRTFNARGETAASKGSFKGSWKKKRCLLPAFGFYEFTKPEGWKKGEPKERLLVRGKGGAPVAFAGLWSRWRGDDPPWETVTIVTTEPNELVAEVHHRMPVVLAPEDLDRWLDPGTPLEEVQELVRPAPEGLLEIMPAPRKGPSPG